MQLAILGRCQRLRHCQAFGHADRPYRELFRSEVLSGKNAAGPLPGHSHAYYLPTAESDDQRRITHVTVVARRGFGPEEIAALTGLRDVVAGELKLRAQLVGLGHAGDFTAGLFALSNVWVSATPFVGPAHVGRQGRQRYLRKALRRELRRLIAAGDVAADGVPQVDDWTDGSAERAGRPRAVEFRRGRSRAGDNGLARAFGHFKLTFPSVVRGPICVGYGCHFGLGMFVPIIGL